MQLANKCTSHTNSTMNCIFMLICCVTQLHKCYSYNICNMYICGLFQLICTCTPETHAKVICLRANSVNNRQTTYTPLIHNYPPSYVLSLEIKIQMYLIVELVWLVCLIVGPVSMTQQFIKLLSWNFNLSFITPNKDLCKCIGVLQKCPC